MVDATSSGRTAAEVDRINRDVTGLAHGDLLPQQTAAGLASQSIAHSLALAVSNATTALRNVQTIMTTIQSVAMSRLLDDDEPGERYAAVIRTATEASRDAARLWREVNDAAQQLLTTLPEDASTGQSQEPSPSPRKAAAGKKAAKTGARKKSAKKAAKTRAAKKAAKTSTAPSGSR